MNIRFAMLLPIALLAACDRKGDEAAVEIRSGNGSTRITADTTLNPSPEPFT